MPQTKEDRQRNGLSDQPGSSGNRHVEVLVICVIAMIGAVSLRIGSNGDSVYTFLSSEVPLAPTCFSKEVMGVSCPGCGLTRSFIHLADFQWGAALHLHRLGWLFFAAAVFQIPYRLLAIKGGRCLPPRVGKWMATALVALLIANWIVGLILIGPLHGN